MEAPVHTTVSELPGSRVRVAVQVAPGEIEAQLQRTARRLGRELKLPGFRTGKVPAPLVLQRVGRDAVLDEAVRDALPGWYAEAIRASGIVPVGNPSVDLGTLPAAGDALELTIEIGVLPVAELGEYSGLEVARREPQAADDQIEQEIEAMRERFARLDTVQRPAEKSDYVVVDYLGRLRADRDGTGEDGATALVPFEGGGGRDQLVELGAGNLIPGFEEGLLGAGAGETRTVEVSFPADYSHKELAGRQASFQITVKEVKEKRLPDLDEDFAVDAGFDDVDELREDVRARLTAEDEQRVAEEFNEAALDAAVARASVAVTDELARARAREMWERMLHSLAHRGVSREAYLRISGRTEEEILAETTPEAERALRREAVLTAIVAAEGIEPSDQDLIEAVTPAAERESIEPEVALERLRADGRIEELREDLAARQAMELIVERAVPIPVKQARAREKLWTPEKGAEGETEHAGESGPERERLWTPTR
jgi:trigger factor